MTDPTVDRIVDKLYKNEAEDARDARITELEANALRLVRMHQAAYENWQNSQAEVARLTEALDEIATRIPLGDFNGDCGCTDIARAALSGKDET